MTLYAIAELIEAKAVDRARNAIKSLLALAPDNALVRQADGSWKVTAVADVPVKSIVRIAPGELCPARWHRDGGNQRGQSGTGDRRSHARRQRAGRQRGSPEPLTNTAN